MSTLPKPGHIIQHDFRNTASRSAAPREQPIRLLQVCCEMIPTESIGKQHCSHPWPALQWNIERGYRLPDIIAEMQQIQADVIALQEIDIGCKRSGSMDTGEAEQTCRAPCSCFRASTQACSAVHGEKPSLSVCEADRRCWPAGVEIAKALQLNYAFFCEFEELESPKRSPDTQASRTVVMTVDFVSCM